MESDQDNIVPYESADWSSSSSDSGCEIIRDPVRVIASNFPKKVKKRKVMDFFEGTPTNVQIYDMKNENPLCLVTFASESEAKKARTLTGRLFGSDQEPISVTPQGNNIDIIYVGGFHKEVSIQEMKNKLLNSSFKSRGVMKNIFLPANPETGSSLGFGYILMDGFKGIYTPFTIDGIEISVRKANLKKLFTAEIEGTDDVITVEENEKTKSKKILLPYKVGETVLGRTEVIFSWRTLRPDVIPVALEQSGYECWTIPIRNAYVAVMTLQGKEQDIKPFSSEDLVKAVDQASVASGRGISKLKHLVPAMQQFVKKMIVHQRPRSGNIADHEGFEEKILSLLKEENKGCPLMISIDVFHDDFDEKEVLYPSEMVSYQRTFENLPHHCLFLTGHGVYNGLDYWQLQESAGPEIRDEGFIKMARHMCLIKQVVELRI